MTENVLIIAAHPDDEWFSAGGTLLRWKASGVDFHVLIVSDGERGDGRGKERMSNSKKLCESARGASWRCLDIPANRLDNDDWESMIRQGIEEAITRVKADIILTHFSNDTHQDHRAVTEIVLSCIRLVPKCSVWFYPSPTSIWFTPNIFVDIAGYADDKLDLYRRFYHRETENREKFSAHASFVRSRAYGIEIGSFVAEGFKLFKGVTG